MNHSCLHNLASVSYYVNSRTYAILLREDFRNIQYDFSRFSQFVQAR